MARLDETDLRVILGPDFAHKMKSESVEAAPVTVEEQVASRARKANKLAEVRFTLFALIIVGLALAGGSFYVKNGLDVQAMIGLALVASAGAAVLVIGAKRRALLTPASASVAA